MNLLAGADQSTDERAEILAKWAEKTKEEILDAKANSDIHIKKIEQENADLRRDWIAAKDELTTKAKFEEYLDQMRSPQGQPQGTTPAKEEDSPRYDPNAVKNMIKEEYSLYEKQRFENSNYQQVETKLREKFGPNFATTLKDQQSKLGLSTDEINTLAKRSPEAFFRVMGLNEGVKDSFQTPPRSAQRNDSFVPRGEPKRDYAFYQAMKKENPNAFFDPKIAMQMEKDAQSMGEAFFTD